MLNRMGNPGDSLTLALSARKAIKSLMAIENGGPGDATLEAAGKDIVRALEALDTGGPIFANLTAPTGFCESYGRIQILKEVGSAIGDAGYRERLLSATAVMGEQEARNRDIKFTIDFFTAVESRAMRNYNQASSSRS